jgi:uncharacterized protein (DUF3084 family)
MTARQAKPWVCGALVLMCVFSSSQPLGQAQVPNPAGAPYPSVNHSSPSADAAAQQIPTVLPDAHPPSLPTKQRDKLLKSNFEQMKQDAHELAKLANSLQEELQKSNANVMSLSVIEKTKEIEKLAKKIRKRAKGY